MKEHSIEIINDAGVRVVLLDGDEGVVIPVTTPFSVNGRSVRSSFTLPLSILATDVTAAQWIADVRCRIVGVVRRFRVASTSGTLQVERLANGTQPGSGVVQLTGTVALSGTADTNASGTLIAVPEIFEIGQALGFVIAGTMTNLLGCICSVQMEKVA